MKKQMFLDIKRKHFRKFSNVKLFQPTYMCSFANAGGMIDCNSIKTDNSVCVLLRPLYQSRLIIGCLQEKMQKID